MGFKEVLKKIIKSISSFIKNVKNSFSEYQEKNKEKEEIERKEIKKRNEYLKDFLEEVKLKKAIKKERMELENQRTNEWDFGNLGKSQSEEFLIPLNKLNKKEWSSF